MNKFSLIVCAGTLLLLSACAGKVPVLGVTNGELKQCPETSNCVYSQAKDKSHYVDPILVQASTRETKLALMRALEQLKGNVVEIKNDYIKVEFVSPVFQFVDDLELYFPEIGSRETLVHIRSASRVGYSDLGVNRERVENIRQIVEAITRD